MRTCSRRALLRSIPVTPRAELVVAIDTAKPLTLARQSCSHGLILHLCFSLVYYTSNSVNSRPLRSGSNNLYSLTLYLVPSYDRSQFLRSAPSKTRFDTDFKHNSICLSEHIKNRRKLGIMLPQNACFSFLQFQSFAKYCSVSSSTPRPSFCRSQRERWSRPVRTIPWPTHQFGPRRRPPSPRCLLRRERFGGEITH